MVFLIAETSQMKQIVVFVLMGRLNVALKQGNVILLIWTVVMVNWIALLGKMKWIVSPIVKMLLLVPMDEVVTVHLNDAIMLRIVMMGQTKCIANMTLPSETHLGVAQEAQ